ncbi:Exonuclease mut-7 [Mortierella claussenii]|nr:Exonuclease mut-7 [Mortierella claussenii]
MVRHSSTATPLTRATLNGRARSFVPTASQQQQYQQYYQQNPQPHRGSLDTFPSEVPSKPSSATDRRGNTSHASTKKLIAKLSSEAKKCFDLTLNCDMNPFSYALPFWNSTLAIIQTITSNNAFLLGQNLIAAYGSLDTFRRAQERGGVEGPLETMATALRSHPDPVHFVISALITVGTVAGFKKMDPDFELAISEFLVAVLQRFLDWHQDHADEWARALETKVSSPRAPATARISTSAAPNSGSFTSAPSSNTPKLGFLIDDDLDHSIKSIAPSNAELEDLITLDDTNVIGSHGMQSLSMQPIIPQRTGSLVVNLLDDDVKSPCLLQMAVLRPVVPDLICLLDPDKLNGGTRPESPASVATTPMSSSVCSYSSTGANDGVDLLTDDSEYDAGDGDVFQIDLLQLDETKRTIADSTKNGTEQSRLTGSDTNDLCNMFNSNVDTTSTTTSSPNEETANTEAGSNLVQGRTGEEDLFTVIRREHRIKLLDEIMAGKNSLQVFVALDVLEMRECLVQSPKDNPATTYGWSLARQLHQRGRYRESSVVVFEYLLPIESDDTKPVLSPSSKTISPSSGTSKSINGLQPLKSSKELPSTKPFSTTTSFPVYQLSTVVRVVVVDSADQLIDLSLSLKSSSVVGMDTEWLPMIEEYEMLEPATRTAILQLACDADSTVYIVDTIAFLDSMILSERLTQIIGELFNHPKILKLAYDWEGDQELLLDTYPALYQEKYRPRNFLDLKHLWFKPSTIGSDSSVISHGSSDSSCNNSSGSIDQRRSSASSSSIGQLPSPLSLSTSSPPALIPAPAQILSSASPPASTKASPLSSASWHSVASVSQTASSSSSSSSRKASPTFASPILSFTPLVELWSEYPAIPGMQKIPGGLSGMLKKLCGQQLDKTQRCSHWEQRPLTDEQQLYAAIDAWCLLDIYAVLETTAKL